MQPSNDPGPLIKSKKVESKRVIKGMILSVKQMHDWLENGVPLEIWLKAPEEFARKGYRLVNSKRVIGGRILSVKQMHDWLENGVPPHIWFRAANEFSKQGYRIRKWSNKIVPKDIWNQDPEFYRGKKYTKE